ncbi:MAG: hypothetical protein JWO38_5763 [Gemmataceae bacterium]|nr:hypothetical protein [Gemmataceae bacterium]
MILPPEAHPLVQVLALHFTSPTYQRFSALLVAAVLTAGRRTVAHLLRTLRHLAPGHPTASQRVLSRAPWSGLRVGCARTPFRLDHLVPEGPVRLAGDDTVDGHPGKSVYGRARHRDAARSSRASTARRYGHTWVVLAVLVKFPFATRPWALPVLVDLCRSEEDDRKWKRPHRTPAQRMGRLVGARLMRFPDRTFVFAGDAGYGAHEVARFCPRHRDRLTRVSQLHPDANRFAPPPPYSGTGRPRVKGGRRPNPRPAVVRAVGWSGGGQRRVDPVEGTGHRYQAGQGLVPVRWVLVRDTTGTHRDEDFFTTDPSLTGATVIDHARGRWDIETTVQERRSDLGWETTRGRCEKTGPRAAPCLLGLSSVVAVLFPALPAAKRTGAVAWPGKATVPLSDARCAVRRWLGGEAVLPQAGDPTGLQKLPDPIRELLLATLAPAT